MSLPQTPPPKTPQEAQEKKKKAAIVAACLLALLLAGWSLVRQIPPRPKPSVSAGGGSPGGPGGGSPGGPGGGYPGGPGGGPRLPGTRGVITAVSADAITIQGRGGAAQTFTLTAATQITVDRTPGTAADLKPGQRGRVVSADGKTASEVHIRTRPLGGGRGGSPAPGG